MSNKFNWKSAFLNVVLRLKKSVFLSEIPIYNRYYMSNKGRQLLLWWSKQDNIVVQNFDHDLNRNWNREKWVWRIDFRLGSSCLGRAESTFMRQFFFAGVEIRNTLLRGFMILRTAHFPIFDVVTLDTSLIGRMLKTRGGKLSGN